MKTKIPPCDPEKQARDPGKVARDSSRDPLPISVPRDQSYDLKRACDPGKVARDSSHDPLPILEPRDQSHDLTQSLDPTRPRDQARYGRATNPLIGVWKTVGKIHRSGIPQGIPHSLSPMDTGTGNMPSLVWGPNAIG